jgi:hypothetical protein
LCGWGRGWGDEGEGGGEGVREERTEIDQMLACHCLFLQSMTSQITNNHEQITNRTKITLDMSAYKSDNKIKIGIL